MLTERGLAVYTRPDGRIFPVDQNAKDVVAILRTYLEDAKVDVRFDHGVTALEHGHGKFIVRTASGEVTADKVIVCAGGSSYPNSGTTGDGWGWARSLGHRVEKVRPALAPIYTVGADPEKSGLALREGVLKARSGGKEIARWVGDMLFTHQGISGPTALGISRVVAEQLPNQVSMSYDVSPSTEQGALAQSIAAWASENPKKRLGSFLDGMVPDRLRREVAAAAGATLETTGWELSAKIRNRLAEVFKALPIGDVRLVPIEKGEVVAGGVSLQEVDPKTMESRVVPGLFWCGEVLDIAGPVGGYNLQAAFSTGYVAGEAAASS
jgi:predicted Rossmann fold flavoprotein